MAVKYSNLQKRIKDHLDIVERARKNAQANQPDSDASALDSVHIDIINTTESEVKKRYEEDKKKLQQESSKRLELQPKIERVSDLSIIKDDIDAEYTTYKASNEGTLKAKFDEYTEALRNLAAFKDRNKLTWHPEYPESTIFNFSVIAILLLVETVLNASFFSVAGTSGLLGGIFKALIISLINVAFGVITGFFILPKINHIDIKKKLWGYFFLATYVILIPIAFNLLVAHYRAALDINAQQAVTIAFDSFVNGPFNIPNVESWILFALGAIISIIACYDGYKLDDPYPEYGSFHREKEKKKEKYELEKKRFLQGVDNLVSKGREKLNNSVSNFVRFLNQFEESIDRSNEIISKFNHGYIDEAHKAISLNIQIYRDSNKRIRTEPVPDYFNESVDVPLGQNFHLKDPSIKNSEIILDGFKKQLDTVEEDKKLLNKEISALRKTLQHDCETMISKLEKSIKNDAKWD